MAVAENAGVKVDSSGQNLENNTVSAADMKPPCPEDQNPTSDSSVETANPTKESTQENDDREVSANGTDEISQTPVGFKENGSGSELDTGARENSEENLKKEIENLDDMLSTLNPMAEEFVPPSFARNKSGVLGNGLGFTNNFAGQANSADGNGHFVRRRRNNGQGKRRLNKRTSMAQREDIIRKTIYVSDIDQQVTEEQLAGLFLNCGQVVDCRICGDPNSVLRFAFIEFTDEEGAKTALNLSGTMLGFYPVRVLPSKTAIAPVNPTFLPRSLDEREMCTRTVYCTNIDKKITQSDLKLFFESICGEIQRLRLLGDYHHQTRIAFVEFTLAESAIAALNCSGVVLGGLPLRISPSKTPVRSRLPRPQF